MVVETVKFRFLCAGVVMACLLSPGCEREAQEQPAAFGDILLGLEHVFVQDRVPRIDVDFANEWELVLKAYLLAGNTEYWPAAFAFDGETLDVVGARIKGKTEFGLGKPADKHSLKLNFDYFGGPRFYAVDKIHLAANKSDPSIMRDALANRAYREMGVKASRTAHATVYADGEYVGLYTMIQDVDKRFLKEHFGTKNNADDGNLYKCVAPGCSLSWRGFDKESYFIESCDERDGCGLVLKTDEDGANPDDHSDIIEFLDILNNTPEGAFEAVFGAVFDVDDFLKFVATAMVIGDYECYLGTLDNFFLYRRPDTGVWSFIPWDHNQSYGAYDCKDAPHKTGPGPDQPWCAGSDRPLIRRILEVPAYRQQYEEYLAAALTELISPARQGQWIDDYDSLIGELVATDPNFGHTAAEYKAAIGDGASTGQIPNLLEFLEDRRGFLLSDME